MIGTRDYSGNRRKRLTTEGRNYKQMFLRMLKY